MFSGGLDFYWSIARFPMELGFSLRVAYLAKSSHTPLFPLEIWKFSANFSVLYYFFYMEKE